MDMEKPNIPKVERLDEIVLDPSSPEQTVLVGSDLDDASIDQILTFLRVNRDCFAWSHEDMVGIPPEVMTHKLNVDSSFLPVKQKRRKFAMERNKIVDEEVPKLLETDKIREVKYPEWLANVVVV